MALVADDEGRFGFSPRTSAPVVTTPPSWIYTFPWQQHGTSTVDVIRYWQAGGNLDELRTNLQSKSAGMNLYDMGGAPSEADLKKLFGAGGGSSGPSKKDIFESLMGQLKTGPWALPFDVSKIVRAVAGKKGDMSMVLNRVLSDPRFKKAFPGIFNKDGTLKMTPAEYRQRAGDYREIASQYGFKPNAAQIAALISGDVSAKEADFRFQAGQTLMANQGVLVQFQAQINDINAARKAAGQPPLPNIKNVKDAFNFITKQGAKDLYATYEAASISAAAREAGLDVGTARARQLAKATAGIAGLEESEQSFKEIAEQLRTAGVELSSFGITQADLETIEFGGSGRIEKAARAEQALKQRQAQVQQQIGGQDLTQNKQGRPVAAQTREVGA